MKTRFHLLLLLLWLVVGTSLRFVHLDSLPPWTDECATMVFSLGNSFRTVPLNQLISADILLQPLQATSVTSISKVIENLLTESTHPPLYFILTHLWMKFFSPVGELASVFVVRSLSALLGVVSIPVMFCFGYFTFRSKLVGQLAAAMMAVSPYTIFLAREARHYSLVILLVIVSLCCLVTAIQKLHRQQSLPIWLVFTWIVINCLGVATHYFFMLTLCAEGLVLVGQIWLLKKQHISWWRMGIVVIGTFIGCLVWIPNLQNIPGSDLTSWVAASSPHTRWLEPLARLLLWLMSMLLLLPSALTTLPLKMVIISGVLTLVFLIWSLPQVIGGLKSYQQDADTNLTLHILIGYVLAAIALTLLLTYTLGKDLTLAARFQFYYAPTIILLLGVAFAGCWHQVPKSQFFRHGKVAVSIMLLMATLGGMIVAENLGYLQNQRPDVLSSIIHKASRNNVLIATTHIHHGQTGRMMGLAWELQTQTVKNLQFFLVAQDPNTPTYTQGQQTLAKQLTQLPRPLDLWLVEYRAPVDLVSQNCTLDRQYGNFAGEYSYKLYRCVTPPTSS
ncbi:MAG TPA: phospholipid carrier-dependent glycosyltransferase [Trichormus sp. M33_DOE_039]|nr:phospholipid carrier-dependent glycosyltransferase [Trichormus sp. M33_DOE_039]